MWEKGSQLKLCTMPCAPPTSFSSPGKCVWNNLIPLKISFFLWELWRDRAPTINNLLARGLIIPNWCSMCKSDAESLGHLFIHCSWVSHIWRFFLDHFGVGWTQPASVRSLLSCWHAQYIGLALGRRMWLLISSTICWVIWEERNGQVFEDKGCGLRRVIDVILAKLYD